MHLFTELIIYKSRLASWFTHYQKKNSAVLNNSHSVSGVENTSGSHKL